MPQWSNGECSNGLAHSGSIAELSLVMGSERRMLPQLSAHNIDLYVRFKDDIFVIFKCYKLLNRFVRGLRNGHPFKIKCEEISSTSISFLEVQVHKTLKAFEVYPVSNPSSLNTPWLSKSSCHVKSVHDAWPPARLVARLKLCSSLKLKRIEKRVFITRAKRENLSAKALATLASTTLHATKRSSKPGTHHVKWAVLPYFPCLFPTGIIGRSAKFWHSTLAKRELDSISLGIQVRVSWSNATRNISQFSKSYWRS